MPQTRVNRKPILSCQYRKFHVGCLSLVVSAIINIIIMFTITLLNAYLKLKNIIW